MEAEDDNSFCEQFHQPERFLCVFADEGFFVAARFDSAELEFSQGIFASVDKQHEIVQHI